MIRRSSPPRRRSPLERGGPIKKANVARQAKRRKLYARKLAAYKRSVTYKLVEARAGGRCEADDRYGRCGSAREFGYRLTHHHKRYGRQFGGNERPQDIAVLCDYHNSIAESEHPTRNRNYSR